MSATNAPRKSTHGRPSFIELLTPISFSLESKGVPGAPIANRKRSRENVLIGKVLFGDDVEDGYTSQSPHPQLTQSPPLERKHGKHGKFVL